jgi:hypothetical protein
VKANTALKEASGQGKASAVPARTSNPLWLDQIAAASGDGHDHVLGMAEASEREIGACAGESLQRPSVAEADLEDPLAVPWSESTYACGDPGVHL